MFRLASDTLCGLDVSKEKQPVKLEVVVHEAEEGGYWAW